MRKTAFFIGILLLCNIYGLYAQTDSMVVFNYDMNGNRTSLNYSIRRVCEDSISKDTICNFGNSDSHALHYNVSVFPNPTNGYLVLASDDCSNTKAIHVRIFSSQGTTIENRVTTSSRTEFDLSDYPAGVYFVSITNNDKRELWKIIKY